MTARITNRDWEILSAYLDGQLSARERTRLEERLRQRADLRATLVELRRVRAMLRSQPRMRAPRSFALTMEMIEGKAARQAAFNPYPALRLASVLASALFILLAIGDALGLAPRQALQPVEAQTSPQALLMAPAAPAPPYPESTSVQPEAEALGAAVEEGGLPETETADLAATGPGVAEEVTVPAQAYPESGLPGTTPTPTPTQAPLREAPAPAIPYPQPQPTLQAKAYPEREALPPAEFAYPAAGVGGAPPIAPSWNYWRLAELGLAVTAVLTGLAAFWYRRTRHG